MSLVTIALGKMMVDVLKKNGFSSVMSVITGDGSNIGNAMV